MASHLRSKSCSFVPQDLPASELFSDIDQNRQSIRELNKQISELTRKTHIFEIVTVNHIRRIDAFIAALENKIVQINGFLHIVHHQTANNSRDILLLKEQIAELTRKVDLLFHRQHARR